MFAYDFNTNRIPGDPPTRKPTGATSVPSTPTTTPTWTSVPSPQPSTSTTASGSSHSRLRGPARQVRLRRRRPARYRPRFHRLRWLHSFRWHRQRVHSLGRGVRVHTGAQVEDSILFDNVDIGRHSKIKRAILDKNVRIPEGTTIGYDLDEDKKRYYVTESGIVVVEGHRSHVELATMSSKFQADYLTTLSNIPTMLRYIRRRLLILK